MAHDQSHDDDEVARLFRENPDLGPDSSLWLRPLRQFIQEGKPVGPVVAFSIALPEPRGSVFGVLSVTRRQRLVFWPVLPAAASMVFSGEVVKALDHITLELPSGRVHATAYDTAGQRVHGSRGWKLRPLAGCNSALWFNLMVRVDVLGQQATAVQRSVTTPSSDAARREREFREYASRFAFSQIELPPHQSNPDYVYFGVCLTAEGGTPDALSQSMLPTGPGIDDLIEGWPDGDIFPIAGSHVPLGAHALCIAAACPPGRLLSDVAFGFPRRLRIGDN
jgi:hypothetical protein